MLKKSVSFFAIMVMFVCSSIPSYATATENTTQKENVTFGTWSRGEVTQDPIPPFSGTMTDSYGNTTILKESPFTGNNVITPEQRSSFFLNKKLKSDVVNPNNFEQNGYYYEYISGSYDESISIYAPKKYLVGHTESYNGTSNPQMLQYAQTNSATVSWSVSSQISSSIEVESAYFSGLSLELGYSFNRTTTTGSSIQILTQIEIDPGDSGYIDAFLPGGYSSGIAKYKEYMLHPYLGFLATGNTLNVNVGGWSPIASSSLNVLNFNTETY